MKAVHEFERVFSFIDITDTRIKYLIVTEREIEIERREREN